MDAKQLRCSVCKHVVALHGGQGRRRAALIEDGLTLCDVCAPAGNHQPGEGTKVVGPASGYNAIAVGALGWFGQPGLGVLRVDQFPEPSGVRP